MSRHGALATVPVIVIGIALSAAAAWMLRQHDQRTILEEFEAGVTEWTRDLQREIDANLEVLRSLADLHDTTGGVRRERFGAFAARAVKRHRGIQALEWAPRVASGQRELYEQEARASGLQEFRFTERAEDGRMVAAADRDEYYPVYFVVPLEGNQSALGFDLHSDATRRRALETARDSGSMQLTAPLTLVQEPGGGSGFLVFMPVYRAPSSDAAARRRNLVGFLLGVYRVSDIVESARRGLELARVGLRIVDDTDPDENRHLYQAHGEAFGRKPALASRSIEVHGRHWKVNASPLPEYFASRRSWQPQAALILGLALTVCVVAYLRVTGVRTRQVEQLVERRTQDLVEANEQLDEQRKILQSVLDNLGDGVAMADAEGRLTLFNPAAEEILGLGLIESGPREWSNVYGLFHPDAQTPVSPGELPLARAVLGEESRDVELYVRNPQREGGVFIRVTATPIMDRQGRTTGGVAVFRDISERKWAEAVLRDSEARFRAIVEATASALIILSGEHRIREFNPQAESVFGLNRADALGRDFLEICVPHEYRAAVTADIRKVLLGETTPGFEIPVPSREGGERTLLWSFSRLSEAGDRESVVIATGHDVTGRRQAERARRVRELAAHLQSAREAERTRVAREIHDELGQALTGLKLEVSFVSRRARNAGPDLRERLDGVGRMIDRTIASVQRIAADLRPQVLDGLGLVEAIRWQAREFEKRTRIRCTVELPEEGIHGSPDRATALFRILQEALTNVVRHSGATRVCVLVRRQGDRLELHVQDDGRGISEAEIADSRSFGLIGMEERAREFGGVLRIESGKPRGTTVSVSLPY